MTKRRIVVHGELPERLTPGDRIAHMHEDVTDLAGRLRAEVLQKAQRETVTGWEVDEDSFEFSVAGRRVVLTAVMSRDD